MEGREGGREGRRERGRERREGGRDCGEPQENDDGRRVLTLSPGRPALPGIPSSPLPPCGPTGPSQPCDQQYGCMGVWVYGCTQVSINLTMVTNVGFQVSNLNPH